MKKFKPLSICFMLLLCLCACGNNNDTYITTSTETTENTTLTQTPTFPKETVNSAIINPENTTSTETLATQQPTQVTTEILNNTSFTEQPETQVQTTQAVESTSKVYEKTGEMAFSDDPENKYIKAVSEKYSLDTKNLAALYTVPDNNGNIVLEFNGTLKPDGTPVRNKDTLIAIYTIDKELNSKCASEDNTKNEYSYGEMKVMFFTVTKHIMPEFEELRE